VREPAQLRHVVRRDGLAVGPDDPGDGEHVAPCVRFDVDAQELDRLDLETGFLQELAAQTLRRGLGLVEEPARQVPVAATRFVAAACE